MTQTQPEQPNLSLVLAEQDAHVERLEAALTLCLEALVLISGQTKLTKAITNYAGVTVSSVLYGIEGIMAARRVNAEDCTPEKLNYIRGRCNDALSAIRRGAK